jgi:hypothetical protein
MFTELFRELLQNCFKKPGVRVGRTLGTLYTMANINQLPLSAEACRFDAVAYD